MFRDYYFPSSSSRLLLLTFGGSVWLAVQGSSVQDSEMMHLSEGL